MDAKLTVEIVAQPHPEAERALNLSLQALGEELAERVIGRFKEGLGDGPTSVREPAGPSNPLEDWK